MSGKQKARSKSEPPQPHRSKSKSKNKGSRNSKKAKGKHKQGKQGKKSKGKNKHKKVRHRNKHRLPQSTTNQVIDDFSRGGGGGSHSALSRGMTSLHLSQKELLSTYKRHRWTQDKDSSIVVIGGNLAGIHLATLLKRRGFHDITVLELADPALSPNLAHDDSADADGSAAAMTQMASSWMLRNPDSLNELIALYADNAKLSMVPVHLDMLEMPLHSAVDVDAQRKLAHAQLCNDASPSHLPALPSTHSSPETVSFASTVHTSSNTSNTTPSMTSNRSSARSTPSMSSSVSGTLNHKRMASRSMTSPTMSTCSASSGSGSGSGSTKSLLKPLNMVEAARRYAKLHQKICGAVDIISDSLHCRLPKVTNPKYINMSLFAFIEKYHLEALLPLFARSHAMLDGLPPLTELPCFYGLYWNDANCFLRMLEGDKQGLWMLTQSESADSASASAPMHTLLGAMAGREQLSVKHGVRVTSLNRYLNDEKHKICIMYDEDEREKLIECDAVFCADDLAHILPAVSDVTEEEEAALGQLSAPKSLCVTLFECASKSTGAIDHDEEEVKEDVEDEETDDDESDHEEEDEDVDEVEEEMVDVNRSRLVRVRCLSRMQHGEEGHSVRVKGRGIERLVAYQEVPMGVGSVDEEAVEAQLVADLCAMGREEVCVVRQRVIALSSRWTAQQIQNEMPWAASNELQGKYKNCYYIGPSVSFQATEAVLDFNQQLMRNTLYL